MKKLSVIALAAVLSMGTPALVFAQQAQTLAPSTNAAAATETNQNDFNAFIAGIAGTDFTTALDTLESANSVTLIKVSTMANADQSKLGPALDAASSNVKQLQDRVSSSDKAMQALKGAGLTAAQVVGIQAAGDGSVTLYVNDWAKNG